MDKNDYEDEGDIRVGKEIEPPLPKCKHCNTYIELSSFYNDYEDVIIWRCPNCKATFEEIEK